MSSNPQSNLAIIIFLKAPIPGQVKTRLAKDIGDQAAAEVYQRLLSHTVSVVSGLPADLIAYHKGYNDPPALLRNQFSAWVEQAAGDLGDRMISAFSSVFKMGYKRVLLIGTDCPGINKGHLHQAFEELNDSDVCFGPADDGGYYLIGLKRPIPELFDDITWSTDMVLQSSLENAEKEKLSVSLIESLNDVDTATDLRSFPSFVPEGLHLDGA